MILSNDNILINKINDFIRKYYKNRIIKGLLISIGSLAGIYLTLIMIEYYFYLNPLVKTILFYSFFVITAYLLAWTILIPGLKFLNIGKHLSTKQAAVIIGDHFKDIEDKLINTLQLIELNHEHPRETALLHASIVQRTNELKIFEFNKVISIRNTIKLLKYSIIPLLVIISLLIFAPTTISEPTNRMIHLNKPFFKPPPFQIKILNNNLIASQQEDFELNIQVSGTEIPLEISINYEGMDFKMKGKKNFVFSYTFNSIQKSTDFKIKADGFLSDTYMIKVFPKPVILSFDLKIIFPSYINKLEEIHENQGDCNVPEGSILNWKIITKDVSRVVLRTDSSNVIINKENSNAFEHRIIANNSFSYTLIPHNNYSNKTDSLQYRIVVIPDGFPSIFINNSKSSNGSNSFFFEGTVKDDYGFSRLLFNYYFSADSSRYSPFIYKQEVYIDKSKNDQIFNHYIDFDSIVIPENTELIYYFEIFDNDGIHGPKSTKSEIKTFRKRSIYQIKDEINKEEQKRDKIIKTSISETKNIRKEIDEVQKRMIDQKTLNWQDKQQLKNILEKNEAITNKLTEINTKSKNILESERKNTNSSERILEKQKQIYELFQQILTEEMKKQVEEIKKLLENVNKEKINDLMEKIKLSNKDLEKELDRNLSLLKQLEIEKRLEETIKELKEKAEELNKLSDKTKQPSDENSKIKENLSKTTDSTKRLLNKLAQIEIDNKLIENPVNIGDTKNKRDTISKNLDESKKMLEKGDKQKSSQIQRSTGKELKELADQLESEMYDSEIEQDSEDAKSIRILLENLIRLSFEEEELIYKTRIVSRIDPRYLENLNKQKEFAIRVQVIEDSVRAIGKRQVLVRPILNHELSSLKENIEMAAEALEARNINLGVAKQQYIMTSLNNIAILMKESLEKMEEKMSQSMNSKSGSKTCKNPGMKSGKRNANDIREMQNNLGKQLEKLRSEIEKSKKADKMGNSDSFNKEMAKLAARQEAIRMELQKLKDNTEELSKTEKDAMTEAAKEMEQLEKDLVNKNLSRMVMERQKQILSRLLESEKAELQREKEEKRESETAKSNELSNPNQKIKYKNKTRTGSEMLKMELPALKYFYKNKVDSYIVKLEQNYE